MVIELRIALAAVIIVFTVVVLMMLRKRQLNLKYTLLWLFLDVVMAVFAVVPELVGYLARLVGVQSVPNSVFMVAGGLGMLILLSITVIVSTLTNRVYSLTQSVALLEKRVRELENK